MYKIVGGDGREYGPVEKELLQRWIREGRVGPHTRVQVAGSSEWKAVSSLSEFAADLAVSSTPPPVSVPSPVPVAPPSPQTSGLAITSLVLGALGLCTIITSIPGLILGIVGLTKINRSGGRIGGKGLAIAGICVSGVALLYGLLMVPLMFYSFARAKTAARTTPRYNPTVDQCVGERMASETARLLDGGGEVVVLSMAGGKYKSVVADAQLTGFRRGLAAHGDIRIAAVVGPAEREMTEFFEGVSEKFFMKVVSDHPNASTIVSFMGLPVFTKEGSTVDTAKLPMVIALNLSAMGQWKDLVRGGVVNAVVLPRYDVRWDRLPKTGDCQTLFDSRYLIVTKENYEEMAQKLKQFYPITER